MTFGEFAGNLVTLALGLTMYASAEGSSAEIARRGNTGAPRAFVPVFRAAGVLMAGYGVVRLVAGL